MSCISHKLILTFEFGCEVPKCERYIQQYFPVVLFIMLYKVVLTSASVNEILKYDHSNESFSAVISCRAVYSVCCTCKIVLTFEFYDKILKCDHSNECY